MTTALPIEPVLPTLRSALRASSSAVLQAPPGAGKTTRVPLALLDESWLGGERILLLEPRRLAARAAAHRMAAMRGERVGETVGYRIRMDTRVGPKTRIEVVTEGVLTRMLQSDPALEGVGLVVFDEFHERSLHADLGLALCLQTQSLLRPELRILVMSATLDGAAVAALLDDAPVVTSEGRSHPVETRYLDRPVEGWIEPAVSRAIQRALVEEEGDVLAFLPGAREIRWVERQLAEAAVGPEVRVLPLFGNLPRHAQDEAIAPSPPDRRKVVLATSIAETSLTIEGVRVVIDSGLVRTPRFSPRSGMTRLETVRVSAASADQRRGRAGRLGPGVCYRLWTESEHHGLLPHAPPEITDADLVPLALELAAWGVTDTDELRWLDVPPAGAFAQARELLRELGALDAEGTITQHGRRMAALGTHPRLAHMLLVGKELGTGALACDLAAVLGERDLLRGDDGPPDADLRLRLEALHREARGHPPRSIRGCSVDRGALKRVLREASHWRERLGVAGTTAGRDRAGLLLALAYPDRIAQQRPGGKGRFLLRNGRGAALPEVQPLAGVSHLVAAELDGTGRESRIFLAAPLDPADLETHFREQIESVESIEWDPAAEAVRARRQERLGALTLKEGTLPNPDPLAVTDALLGGVAQKGLDVLPWTKTSRQLQQRLVFLHSLDPSWPDVSDGALSATLPTWLGPHVLGMKRLSDLQRLDLTSILQGMLAWNQHPALEELAPTHVVVPSGSRVPVDYGDPAAPVLAVRLQELFGLTETPRVAGGEIPLTLHLLSPAHRPVQVTQDLASFWEDAYFEVRKDLKGRYPKHYWPDDPLRAAATRRTKPR